MQIEIKLSDKDIEQAIREWVNRRTKFDMVNYQLRFDLKAKQVILTHLDSLTEKVAGAPKPKTETAPKKAS